MECSNVSKDKRNLGKITGDIQVMATKVKQWVTTVGQAIASGAMKSALQFSLMQPDRRVTYLAEKYPNLPADESNTLSIILLQARQAGMDITANKQPLIPVIAGVPMVEKLTYHYDCFVRSHETTANLICLAAWGEI